VKQTAVAQIQQPVVSWPQGWLGYGCLSAHASCHMAHLPCMYVCTVSVDSAKSWLLNRYHVLLQRAFIAYLRVT
jgi:hypothetical protein